MTNTQIVLPGLPPIRNSPGSPTLFNSLGTLARPPRILIYEPTGERQALMESILRERCRCARGDDFEIVGSNPDLLNLVDPGTRQLLIVGEPSGSGTDLGSRQVYPARAKSRTIVATPLWFRPRGQTVAVARSALTERDRFLMEAIFDAPDVFEDPPEGKEPASAYEEYVAERVRGFLDGTWPRPRS